MTAIPSIRPATPDDFDALLEIREEVAVDLLERGIPSNPNALTRQHLEEWTSAGVLWVAELDGAVIGSIAVWFHDPTNYWPRADLASYIRDLMVHPRLSARGHWRCDSRVGRAVLGRSVDAAGSGSTARPRTSGSAAITRRPDTATS